MNLTETLRGDPTTLIQFKRSNLYKDRPAREDGSPQGPGYFGEVATREDEELIATELASGAFNVAGTMARLIPMIVPTLTRQELVHLVDGGRPTWGIVEKAKAHAELRISKGVSVFAEEGEQRELPTS
jgi:hypothetical protein